MIYSKLELHARARFSFGSSSSSSRPYPKFLQTWFQGAVMPRVQQQFDAYDPSGGPLRAAADAAVGDTVSGKYLNPATNTALSGAADAITSRVNEQFGDNLARANSGLERLGKFGSARAMNIGAQTARQSAQDLGNQLSGLYWQNYQTERPLMEQAVSRAYGASQYDLNQLMEFINAMRGGSSSSSSLNIGMR